MIKNKTFDKDLDEDRNYLSAITIGFKKKKKKNASERASKNLSIMDWKNLIDKLSSFYSEQLPKKY